MYVNNGGAQQWIIYYEVYWTFIYWYVYIRSYIGPKQENTEIGTFSLFNKQIMIYEWIINF